MHKMKFAVLALFLTSQAFMTKSVKFWHVTDFHHDPSYYEEGYSCYNRTTYRPSYGNYKCDSPWILINSSVYAMKSIEPNPDFIIWTGDDTPHVKNQSVLGTEMVLEIIRNQTKLLMDVFPATPIYAALGNHDYHPKHQMPPNTNTIYKQVAEQWQPWLNGSSEANRTFRHGAFYSLPLPGTNLRAIVLNTVFYYKNDKLTGQLDDPAGQFDWFDKQMTNASSAGEKVYIIAHVPPGQFEKHRNWSWFYPKFNIRFNNLIRKHAQSIGGMFFGHHHTDSYRLIYGSNGTQPVAAVLIAPAVTPWETSLANVTGSAYNNPAIRLYSYAQGSPEKLDFIQYYANLTMASDARPLQWMEEYTASTVYSIPDVTPTSLHNLTERMKKDNSAEFKSYYKHNGVSAVPGEVCDGLCKTVQLCAIQNINYDDYDKCVNKPASTNYTTASSPYTTIKPSTSVPPSSSGHLLTNWSITALAMTLAAIIIPIFNIY